jgi:endonuclease/exonuclease/phosphatase family metal-dependent hydrolase
MNRILRVYTHNILAPRWAIPKYYPNVSHPLLLDTATRFAKAMGHIVDKRPDIVFLQEVDGSHMDLVEEKFTDTYHVSRNYHHIDLWNDWTDSSPSRPEHGLVTLIHNSLPMVDSRNVQLSPDGNCGSIVTLDLPDTSTKIFCVNTHLETLDEELRNQQLSSMGNHLVHIDPSNPILWGGDFNMDLTLETKPSGFDRLSLSGDTVFDLSRNQKVDFILSRSASVSGKDSILCQPTSVSGKDSSEEVTSLASCLEKYGSDHVPVWGEFDASDPIKMKGWYREKSSYH